MKNIGKILLVLLFAMAFAMRIWNINYNSPHKDEAIYQVIGKMGLFYGDWGTLSPRQWMAGDPYIYPTISAISSVFGGIVPARIVNVVFGMLALFFTYKVAAELARKKKQHAGLIATATLGLSGLAAHVSRLATYDMPSFLFLTISAYFLIKASKRSDNGKQYFVSALFLFLSAATKVVIFPLIVPMALFSYYYARADKTTLFYWKRYFILTLLALSGIYLIWNMQSFLGYAESQIVRTSSSYSEVLRVAIEHIDIHLYFFILGSIGLITAGRWKLWIALSLLAVYAIVVHLVLQRLPTLDKHIYLTLTATSVIFALGVSEIFNVKKISPQLFWITVLIVGMFAQYGRYQVGVLGKFDESWSNSANVSRFLADKVKPGEKILTEEGPSVMLAVYDNLYPANVTTFDWFTYQEDESHNAYILALRDGYFKYVEIESVGTTSKDDIHKSVNEKVTPHIDYKYQLVFEEGGYLVYERVYE